MGPAADQSDRSETNNFPKFGGKSLAPVRGNPSTSEKDHAGTASLRAVSAFSTAQKHE
jgi:hypothetical protein